MVPGWWRRVCPHRAPDTPIVLASQPQRDSGCSVDVRYPLLNILLKPETCSKQSRKQQSGFLPSVPDGWVAGTGGLPRGERGCRPRPAPPGLVPGGVRGTQLGDTRLAAAPAPRCSPPGTPPGPGPACCPPTSPSTAAAPCHGAWGALLVPAGAGRDAGTPRSIALVFPAHTGSRAAGTPLKGFVPFQNPPFRPEVALKCSFLLKGGGGGFALTSASGALAQLVLLRKPWGRGSAAPPGGQSSLRWGAGPRGGF